MSKPHPTISVDAIAIDMPAAEQPKSLSAFIHRSHSEIIGEFSAFARTLMPPIRR